MDHDRLRAVAETVRARRGQHQADARFSDGEYKRRFASVREEMDAAGVDCLVLYGDSSHAGGGQQSIRYLTGHDDQIASSLVVPAEGEPTLFITLRAQLPDACRTSPLSDVRGGGFDPAPTIADRIAELGHTDSTIGLAGSVGATRHLPADVYIELRERLPSATFEFLDDVMDRVTREKSDAELPALRAGAALTDRSMRALRDAIEPGVTERELAAAVRAAPGADGEHVFQLLGATSMADPDMAVPWDHQSTYRLGEGDAVLAEISAKNPQGYSGQLLRTIAVGEPTGEYVALHEAAVAVFEGVLDVLEPGATTGDVVHVATEVIEGRGYTHLVPVLHGWGLGIQGPVVGTPNSAYGDGTDGGEPFVFEAGQTMVIEPSPVTPDLTTGVVLGELVHVTPDGAERLHDYPLELVTV